MLGGGRGVKMKGRGHSRDMIFAFFASQSKYTSGMLFDSKIINYCDKFWDRFLFVFWGRVFFLKFLNVCLPHEIVIFRQFRSVRNKKKDMKYPSLK